MLESNDKTWVITMKITSLLFAILILFTGYLTLWPVPIDPQPWTPSADAGFTGPFAPNDRLADLALLDLDGFHGPEDVVIANEDGRDIVYTTSQDGVIIRIDTEANKASVFAQTGGVPLGMERDDQGNFVIADAFRGLLSVSPDGQTVTVLTDSFAGQPIKYADDLDIAANGVIYFSDASTKFGAQAIGSTLGASLMEISEHGNTGRVLAFDPSTGETSLVKDGFSFSNGIAMCPESDCILVNETGEYRVHKLFVDGPRKGDSEILIDNLPGFPDNINPGSIVDGKQTYWLGLASPRSKELDDVAQKPFMRALSYRLPESFRMSPTHYSIVIQVDENGQILQTLQDPEGSYPVTTGAIEGSGWLYVTSLVTHQLGRIPYPD